MPSRAQEHRRRRLRRYRRGSRRAGARHAAENRSGGRGAVRSVLPRCRQAEQPGVFRVGAEAVAEGQPDRCRQRRALWRADRHGEQGRERERRAQLSGDGVAREARQRDGDPDRRREGPRWLRAGAGDRVRDSASRTSWRSDHRLDCVEADHHRRADHDRADGNVENRVAVDSRHCESLPAGGYRGPSCRSANTDCAGSQPQASPNTRVANDSLPPSLKSSRLGGHARLLPALERNAVLVEDVEVAGRGR